MNRSTLYKVVSVLAAFQLGIAVFLASLFAQAEVQEPQAVVQPDREAVPVGSAAATTEYHVEVGDGLDVTVWQAPELSRSVTVRPDGRISYPLAQEITVAGLTVPEAEQTLAQALSRYVKTPAVSIVVTQFAGEKVMILGEVIKPGVYRFTGRTTLIEALGLAGGYTEGASFEDVTVTDRTGKVVRVDLNKLLIQGNWLENIVLHGGDVIFVRTAQRVFVLGEVHSPGAYSLGRGGETTVVDLVMRAGGPTDAAQTGSVRVIRKIHEEKPQVSKLDLRRAMKGTGGAPRFAVRSGDVIYVPRSTISKIGNLIVHIDRALSMIATGQGIIYDVDYHRWAKQAQERSERAEGRAVRSEERADKYLERDTERLARERDSFEFQKEAQEFLRQQHEWERERFEDWESEN